MRDPPDCLGDCCFYDDGGCSGDGESSFDLVCRRGEEREREEEGEEEGGEGEHL